MKIVATVNLVMLALSVAALMFHAYKLYEGKTPKMSFFFIGAFVFTTLLTMVNMIANKVTG